MRLRKGALNEHCTPAQREIIAVELSDSYGPSTEAKFTGTNNVILLEPKGKITTLIIYFIFAANVLLLSWPSRAGSKDMDQVANLHNLIVGSCDFAVILLILLAVGSIILFLKVFKSDFGRD